ncbi:MAG: hypothetical protein ACKVKF_26680, partial [Rhodobacterales bacterium]
MASNAAHGGARPGAGRPRGGPANSAPEFAASGKSQRTLEGAWGFQRSSNTQQPADADGESGASLSDSHANMTMDASESASAAAPATGQGSPLTPMSSSSSSTTTEQQQPQQADHAEQPDDHEKQQRHGDATTTAAKVVKPRRGVANKLGGKTRDEIAKEINEAKGLDNKTCISARNIFNPEWVDKFPWMYTLPQELSPGQQPDFVGCVACRWLRQKYGMSDAISKCEMPGSSREMRQDKLKNHGEDPKHKRAMLEWIQQKEEGASDDAGPVLEAGLFQQATPLGIANLIKVAVSTAARLKPLSHGSSALVFRASETNHAS